MSAGVQLSQLAAQSPAGHSSPMSYTGIGSRQTPEPVLSCIRDLARKLAQQNWVLRSGGASEADAAFERGCDQAQGRKEIFLPLRGFNSNSSRLFLNLAQFDDVRDIDAPAIRRAMEFALKFHPLATHLLAPTKRCELFSKLMTRNSQQVLGKTVSEEDKSCFLICWTQRGEPKGGTQQAIILGNFFQHPGI